MFRLIIVTIISLCSLIPFLVITRRYLEMGDPLSEYISMILGWVILPFVLLKIWKAKPDVHLMPIDIDDPIMIEHIEWARRELNRFFIGLDEGKLEAFIKFPHNFNGEIEHVWGAAHSRRSDFIITSLASYPVGEPGEEVMERMQIPISKIEDWMLCDAKGKTYGGYTTLAHAKIYERDYGKLPKKYAEDLQQFVDFSWKK